MDPGDEHRDDQYWIGLSGKFVPDARPACLVPEAPPLFLSQPGDAPKTSTALRPPNANEFDITWRTFKSRPTLGM